MVWQSMNYSVMIALFYKMITLFAITYYTGCSNKITVAYNNKITVILMNYSILAKSIA